MSDWRSGRNGKDWAGAYSNFWRWGKKVILCSIMHLRPTTCASRLLETCTANNQIIPLKTRESQLW